MIGLTVGRPPLDQSRELMGHHDRVQGALQLRIDRYGWIRFAQVPERVSTKSFVILIKGISRSNHLGAQGTVKGALQLLSNRYM